MIAPLRSLRVRLTLWYVLLLAVILVAFSAIVYLSLREVLYSNIDDSLDGRADISASLATNADGLRDSNDIDIPGDPLESEHFTRIFDADGEVIFDNSVPHLAVPVDPDAVERALAGRSSHRHVDEDEGIRIYTRAVRIDDEIVGVVEVGLSEGDLHEPLDALPLIFAIVFPLTLVIATVGGVFLSGRALSPIDRMTRVARRITAEDLSQRLGERTSDDEVGRLASTFDEMIARLDDAFRRQRQFTADASHELRTPLTAIKGQTEVALQRERNPAEYQQVLRLVNTEVDRMIRLVASLLSLARADSGEIPLARDDVSLNDLVQDAVGQIRSTAEDKNVSIENTSGASVRLIADQDLLVQLLLNLLDNAVKYTPSGGNVRVALATVGDLVELRIADTGAGIAPEHHSRIFDRFYRVDAARGSGSGAGLGLSISRWIVARHGGNIGVESALGEGATFVVRLPLR